MKRICLVCNLGMSTSLLVRNMEKYAHQIGEDITIAAFPISEAEKNWKDWDIIMLGPQVRHVFNRLNSKIQGEIPIVIIDMRDYGMMNGEKVLKAAYAAMDNQQH